jgi:hypothetical protein
MDLPGGKGRPARKADNLTASVSRVTRKVWESRHLKTLWASTAGTALFYIFLYNKMFLDLQNWHIAVGIVTQQ